MPLITMCEGEKVALSPGTLLAPLPVVMVSCQGTQPGFDRPNIITIAWTGVVCTRPPMLSISVRPERFSYEQIVQSGAFVVNLVGRSLARQADFCGVRSGREVDKFASQGLTPVPVSSLNQGPMIKEAPLSLACRVTQMLPLGSHHLFLASIEQVLVQPSLMDDQGRLCLERAELVSYRHGQYVPTGDAFGFFGYSVAAPEVLARRLETK